jgi:hypothetical protein
MVRLSQFDANSASSAHTEEKDRCWWVVFNVAQKRTPLNERTARPIDVADSFPKKDANCDGLARENMRCVVASDLGSNDSFIIRALILVVISPIRAYLVRCHC